MREIKFRAWDKDRKCFLSCIVGNTDETDDNWICPLTFCEVNGIKDWYHNDTCEVMQYTGLHDKNGKEIYEGDIVKRHFFTDYNCCCNVSELIGEVIFEDSAFIVKNGKYITPLFVEIQECNGESFKHYEVIGNIYENTELLKEN